MNRLGTLVRVSRGLELIDVSRKIFGEGFNLVHRDGGDLGGRTGLATSGGCALLQTRRVIW